MVKAKVPPPNPAHVKFLAAYSKRIVDLALATRRFVLEEAPGASELIYDAYSAVSAGYTFTGRQSDCFVYVAAYTKRVNLGFWRGATLPDPARLLQGTGKVSRHVPIEDIATLSNPALKKLLRVAIKESERASIPATSEVRAIYKTKRRP